MTGGMIISMLFNRPCLRVAWYLLWVSVVAAGQGVKLDLPAIEASAKEELAATGTPGAAIGVVSDGRLIYAHGFGTSNLETGVPVTEQTLFRLGSTTKMLTRRPSRRSKPGESSILRIRWASTSTASIQQSPL